MRRPHWRKMSWVILIWNALMIAWLVAALTTAHNGSNCGTFDTQACHDAYNTGLAIGAGVLVAIWVVGDIILGIIWLVTKGNRRGCPACGLPVKAGVVQCKKCGCDFRVAAAAAARPAASRWQAAPMAAPSPLLPTAPAVPAGWYPDAQMPGQVRYWDGTQWTQYTQASPPA